MRFAIKVLAVLAIIGVAFAFTFERPPIDVVQHGFRGVGMQQVYNTRAVNSESQKELNKVPEPQGAVDKAGQPASAVYQNVQVLKNVDANDFLRLMAAMTEWVSPDNGEPNQGCAYCHNTENMADDTKYSHKVARRMIQMTQHLNANWKNHVGNTGVTCYTCHRGNNVPKGIWFAPEDPVHQSGLVGNRAGQNAPAKVVGMASLPSDIFRPFLEGNNSIRVNSTTALPSGNRSSIKQAEHTYGLMMHMSQSLGVNCTYCHNTRQQGAYDNNLPQFSSAWYGVRMTRDVNNNYITPLTNVFPPHRLGPQGDVGKTNCVTCHQGAYKPLYGASMIGDYPDLARDTGAQQASLVTPGAVTPAVAPPSLPAAVKDQVENAFVFRVDGKDSSNKGAAFDFIILTEAYTWVKGSSDQVVSNGQPVPNEEVAQRVINPQLRASLEKATDMIAVGVASSEGDRGQEEARADRRSQTVVNWLATLGNQNAGVWRINLGQYNKSCESQRDADTSFQRPLIMVGVRSRDEGTNLQEALASAISGKSNLPSRECYSRFDLAKVR